MTFHYTNVDPASPECVGCGEKIRYNSKAAGIESSVEPGKLLNGWSHGDGMKRDHDAAPPFGVSGEDHLTRQNALRDQARSRMKEHLSQQFDQLHIRNEVNSAFQHPDLG